MICFFCKGDMEDCTTTHLTDTDSCIAVIKNVPCHTCVQCGAIVYSLKVGKQLEQIINTLKSSLTEVAIVHYSDKAA
jgi:YgiT-type zinc finger domain-containing protein